MKRKKQQKKLAQSSEYHEHIGNFLAFYLSILQLIFTFSYVNSQSTDGINCNSNNNVYRSLQPKCIKVLSPLNSHRT